MKKSLVLCVLPLFALLAGCGHNTSSHPVTGLYTSANGSSTANNSTANNEVGSPTAQPSNTAAPLPDTSSAGFTLPTSPSGAGGSTSGSTGSSGGDSIGTGSNIGTSSTSTGSGGTTVIGGSAQAIPIKDTDSLSQMPNYLTDFDFKGYFTAHPSEQADFQAWTQTTGPLAQRWQSDMAAYHTIFEQYKNKSISYSTFQAGYNQFTEDMIRIEEQVASTPLSTNASPAENAGKMAWIQFLYDGNVVVRETNFYKPDGSVDATKFQQFQKDNNAYLTVAQNFQTNFG